MLVSIRDVDRFYLEALDFVGFAIINLRKSCLKHVSMLVSRF